MTTSYHKNPPAYGASEQCEDKRAPPVSAKTNLDAESQQEGPGPRYIPYRVYAPDGAIPARKAPDPGNPFIGRIKATSVPPPHNVLSLKRALGKAEGLLDPSGCRTLIYRLHSATLPEDATARVSLLGPGLGETPETAVALVFHGDLSKLEYEARCSPSVEEAARTYTQQYVYYHLHTLSGEEPSARALDRSEPAIGRIDKMEIAPPNDVQSVKRCIARAEGKPIYKFGQMYGDPTDSEPCADDAPWADDAWDDAPGSTPTAALLLVRPERRAGLHNRPLRVLEAQCAARTAFWSSDLTWLAACQGDVMH
ncbi:hypothetical protein B0H17DRAFT_1072205 [Mycena rosella]|uniref:Uncharacterized protein n=1 Tax=Mycena rosella TaxID=1033263 RepID=A0AAD7D9V9_MYCRO|nr:hypothetical protein B0H17DRAFT_1072205 [Mycena rosella]